MQRRIDFEVHYKTDPFYFMAYAINSGGVTLSIFNEDHMADRNPRHMTISDEFFFDLVEKLNKLAEEIKREK